MRLMDEVRENRLLARWAELLPRAPRQQGGVHEADAELLRLPGGTLLALTVDAVDAEVRCGLYRSPATAGRTAVVASLADLAAVGADPLGLLLSVCLPGDDPGAAQEAVARGVADACGSGVGVLGGDTEIGESLTVTCVAAGLVPEGALRRRVGLRPGDRLYASGPLGTGSALCAARWLGVSGFGEQDYRPPVRVAQGLALRGIASACMDTSDGLLATLDQLARLNDTALVLDPPLERLLEPRADAVRRAAGLTAFTFLAGHHGEFELVFGVPPARESDLDRVAEEIGWRPIPLGRVEAGAGLRVGRQSVDGARVRNLLAELGGDVAAYVRGLEALGAGR